ncbi:hypothetical protein [Jeotgalibaca dankookensis]|uniref:hypothetical protein n=1 Tax=Jeotgalibaca dankookensis TaxID=708126 RepID=UPI0007854FAF|nr:hypothetical protein [Jeotgalibaca dankookensis]
MDSHTLLSELKRLVKNNKKRMSILFIIFTLVLLFLQMLPVILTNFGTDGDASNKTAQENKENPAIFEVYIEYDSGSTFTNTLLLEQAMKSAENITEVEAITGVDISSQLEQEEEMKYPKTARDRGVLGAARDDTSNIWAFNARIGTEKENLAAMTYFYDLVMNDGIPLLDNKHTYSMSQPRILTDEELLSPNSQIEQDTSGEFSLKGLVMALVISIFGATVLAALYILVKSFIGDKIAYAFNYSWGEQDVFILASEQEANELKIISQLPQGTQKIYLAQEPDKLRLNADLIIQTSLVRTSVQAPVDEVIVYIQPGITDKNWYNQQRELLKAYQQPLKIIQVNQ